jgi:hypothetical protein
MAISDFNTLPRLIATLYTEVFQNKPDNPNKPINKGSHLVHEQLLTDAIKTRLEASGGTYIWGPGGVSDEAATGGTTSVRWSFTGIWG